MASAACLLAFVLATETFKLAPCGTDGRLFRADVSANFKSRDTKTRLNIANPAQSNLDIVPHYIRHHDSRGVWRSGNGICRINEVTLRRARLVLGWVTVRRYAILVSNEPLKPSRLPTLGRIPAKSSDSVLQLGR